MKAHALALFTILVWSTTFVATKVLLAAGLTPLWILVIRFALGFAALPGRLPPPVTELLG